MAAPCRSFFLALAIGLGAAVAPALAAAAVPAQDPGATFGTGEATTTLPVSTTAPTASTTTTASTNNQTLVESADQPDQPIFTESRKVAAVVGGLVLVALAILLLTIRYIRVTKPVAVTPEAGLPMLDVDEDIDDSQIFSADLRADAPASVDEPSGPVPALAVAAPGTDHVSADADWEPRTDEHQRVEIPSAAAPARPSTAARRRTLGVPAD